MASVRLGRYEVEEYELPRVCAKCGRKAVARPSKTFSWHPPWVIVLIFAGLLIYVIVALVLTKRMAVPLPLCERHRNYWRNRAIVIYGGLLALVLGVGGVVVASVLDEGGKDNAVGLACIGTGLVFIVWLFAAAIMQATSIRPNEVTDRSITLVGLSGDFVEAVREDRRDDTDEEDEDDRPRRRRPRDEDDEDRVRRQRALDDDEDDRPRSKRLADEDDGGYYDPEAKRRQRDRDDEDDR
jgi:hypothetical protein